jgi:mannose-1-phosphate guanylyltransferase
MDYSLIIAGGAGTRLWPMSRQATPKQLIPFIAGKSLLQLAVDRLDGLLPPTHQFICAGQSHADAIQQALSLPAAQYLAEPVGRDTLNAVGLGAAVLARRDPDAVVAILTADHIIEPVAQFQSALRHAFALARRRPNAFVTFGVAPTHPATGYGYLELAGAMPGDKEAHKVSRYKEKPDAATAQQYVDAGPERYLWNAGMFVFRAATMLDAIMRFAPENHAGLMKIAGAWDTNARDAILAEVYPRLPKISIDYAVMEPVSRDPRFELFAIPLPCQWLDVGSWPSLAQTLAADEHGNASQSPKAVTIDSKNTFVASSDANHLVVTLGVSNLIVIHTQDATLVCDAGRCEEVKNLQAKLRERFGDKHL